ncbi:hypothetical protein [Yinghuangia seranimata]|uniref:hypothetical protein n=1 Tax=Yinghuangia seranimata TaxID=408067 RepID=UPI00248BEC64|nr:hypothetical protein [Yinghuangia seranimata]MDI2126352.1 hypothetical protein [Yinghuangia seranimata]
MADNGIDDTRLSYRLSELADEAGPLRPINRDAVLTGAARARRIRAGVVAAMGAAAFAAAVGGGIVVAAGAQGDGATVRTGAETPAPNAPTNMPGSPTPSGAQHMPLPITTAPTLVPGLPSAGTEEEKEASIPRPTGTAIGAGPWDMGGGMPEPVKKAAWWAWDVGPHEFRDIYVSAEIDDCKCTISVWLTDLSKKDAFVQELKKHDPSVDGSVIKFVQATHSAKEARAQADKIRAQLMKDPQPGFWISSVNIEHGSEIQVKVDNAAAAQAYFDRNHLVDPGFTLYLHEEKAPDTPPPGTRSTNTAVPLAQPAS